MDSLWGTASTIVGPGYRLNPAEAFVLGVAFLVHDIAMSKAAYALTKSQIQDDRSWPDTVGQLLRARLGRPPTTSELESPPDDVVAIAEHRLLRELHAQQAAQMGAVGWTVGDNTFHLIADDELRHAYGRVIGMVAASHHLAASQLADELGSPVGAPVFLPSNWTVNPLVLGCILRTADAAHLDAGRAPSVLMATRDLDALGRLHWGFQSKLQQPFPQDDRLVFTSSVAFQQSEADEWWMAYDTLRMVDDELRACDALLEERAAARFAVRGVARIELATQLKTLIPCEGWEPVHAGVHVSEVAELVRKLGGRQLYGDRPEVALRELVANATDAVRALNSLNESRGLGNTNGRVELSLENTQGSTWLTISDTGIGMSKAVLTGPLLDFGSSSWLAGAVLRDNPGLAASPFEPTGRFGIGFFASFMVADSVAVVSRARSAAEDDTWVLEFASGLEGRANLRRAQLDERLPVPGTRVRLAIQSRYVDDGELSLPLDVRAPGYRRRIRTGSLRKMVRLLAPASDVDIWVRNSDGSREKVIAASDWVYCDGVELLSRLNGIDFADEWERAEALPIAEYYSRKLELIHDEFGKPVARIALADGKDLDNDFDIQKVSCMVTAGICSSDSMLWNVVGLVLGRPDTAARGYAEPIFPPSVLKPWASDALTKLEDASPSTGAEWKTELIDLAAKLGVDSSQVRGWRIGNEWLTGPELEARISQLQSILVTSAGSARVVVGVETHGIELDRNVVAFDEDRTGLILGNAGGPWSRDDSRPGVDGIMREFRHIVQRAWSLENPPVLDEDTRDLVRVGEYSGNPVEDWCWDIRRTQG